MAKPRSIGAKKPQKAKAERGGALAIRQPNSTALAVPDEGYRTTGTVGKGRKREGIGSGSPLDVRERNADKLNAIKRLQTEGTGGERENAVRAEKILRDRQALRKSKNPNQFGA